MWVEYESRQNERISCMIYKPHGAMVTKKWRGELWTGTWWKVVFFFFFPFCSCYCKMFLRAHSLIKPFSWQGCSFTPWLFSFLLFLSPGLKSKPLNVNRGGNPLLRREHVLQYFFDFGLFNVDLEITNIYSCRSQILESVTCWQWIGHQLCKEARGLFMQ